MTIFYKLQLATAGALASVVLGNIIFPGRGELFDYMCALAGFIMTYATVGVDGRD